MSCTNTVKNESIFGLSGPNQTPHSSIFFLQNLRCGGNSFIARYNDQMLNLVDLKTGTPSEINNTESK